MEIPFHTNSELNMEAFDVNVYQYVVTVCNFNSDVMETSMVNVG